MMAMHFAGRHHARQTAISSSFPRVPISVQTPKSPAFISSTASARFFHRPARIHPCQIQHGIASPLPASIASPCATSSSDALSSLRGQIRSLRTMSRLRQAPQGKDSSASRSSSGSTPAVPASVVPPSPTAPAVTAPPPSWLDNLPASIKWTRPYFDLARLDKPIGSWLLYWPCGERPCLA